MIGHAHEPEFLVEFTYKDFLNHLGINHVAGIKRSNLPYRDWEPLIRSCRLVGVKNNIAKFFLPNRWNGWHTFIQFVQWYDEINDDRLTPMESARLLLWSGDIKVHCGCPSYKFWGHQYVATQLDAAIEPETRFPHVRNPKLLGAGCCKHLRRTMRVLPFYAPDLAKAIREQRAALKKD